MFTLTQNNNNNNKLLKFSFFFFSFMAAQQCLLWLKIIIIIIINYWSFLFFFFSFMATQQCLLWLKIEAFSYEFPRASCKWFWILGSHESNTSNGFHFRVETKEIWYSEARLCKGYTVTGLHMGLISFGCFGSFFRATCWAWKLLNYGQLYRSFF